MVVLKDGIKQPADEVLSGREYSALAEQNLYTEQEAIQEEIITRIPGFIQLMLQYEWKPILKIVGSIVAMVAIYFLIGWDAVAAAVALFIFMTVVSYLIQSKNQERDSTIFVEMKLPGQKISTGDHSPYTKSFYTTEKRFAVWEVPNALIRHGLFKMPGEQEPSMMPGTGNIVFVDLFDRINRTCVLPRDMDVANIALATNANPMLASKMNEISETIKLDKKTERLVLDWYSMGKIDSDSAQSILQPIRIRKKALMSPTGETKRDIFFELQSVIPELREKLAMTSNKIFLLADFLAARGIYQSINKPMPEQVRKDHRLLYEIMGIPQIKNYDKNLSDE